MDTDNVRFYVEMMVNKAKYLIDFLEKFHEYGDFHVMAPALLTALEGTR